MLDLSKEKVVPSEPALNLGARFYEHVERKRDPYRFTNFKFFLQSRAFGDDDEEIDVGILCRRAVGVRTE